MATEQEIKRVRLEYPDSSVSVESYPIGTDTKNISHELSTDKSGKYSLADIIGDVDMKEGNIADQLRLKTPIKNFQAYISFLGTDLAAAEEQIKITKIPTLWFQEVE